MNQSCIQIGMLHLELIGTISTMPINSNAEDKP